MWILFVIGIMIIFIAWCKMPSGVRVLTALFLVLATPFTGGISFVIVAMLVILSSIFGKYF